MKSIFICLAFFGLILSSCATPTKVLVHKYYLESERNDTKQCLNEAFARSKHIESLSDDAKKKLDGINTTEFLFWASLSGPKPVINPDYKVPSQMKSLIPPVTSSKLISDLYVLCLLENGYEIQDKSALSNIYKHKFDNLNLQMDKNDPEVFYNLAVLYEEGWGVNKNMEKAINFYSEAAGLEYTPAEYYLGVIYDKGRGVEQDKNKAFQLYNKAAVKGHAQAQFNLGVCYRRGWGTPQNDNKAIEWLTKAKENGFPYAEEAIESIKNERKTF